MVKSMSIVFLTIGLFAATSMAAILVAPRPSAIIPATREITYPLGYASVVAPVAVPKYGYVTTNRKHVGYTSYSRYPSTAYVGDYYPYVDTLGGYYSVNPVGTAYTELNKKK